MLRPARTFAAVVAALLLLTPLGQAVAAPLPEGGKCTAGAVVGTCLFDVTAPGRPDGGGAPRGESSDSRGAGGSAPRGAGTGSGQTVAGNVRSGSGAISERARELARRNQQRAAAGLPPLESCGGLVGASGTANCVTPGVVSQMMGAPGAPAPPPPPNPAQIAQVAVTQMNLKAIDIGIVPEARPGSRGIIGMPTWMWVADPGESTTGPITRSASVGDYSVTADATLDRIVWAMGDGTTVTCHGRGTPYADAFGKQPSPTCGHTYVRKGRYIVTATSYWTVTWAGVGESGVIPLQFSSSVPVEMGEVQVIVTN